MQCTEESFCCTESLPNKNLSFKLNTISAFRVRLKHCACHLPSPPCLSAIAIFMPHENDDNKGWPEIEPGCMLVEKDPLDLHISQVAEIPTNQIPCNLNGMKTELAVTLVIERGFMENGNKLTQCRKWNTSS